jgi:hypothetical protein
MSHIEALSQWKKTVSTSFGHLSGPQARGLALWSFGMVLAKSCGITSVFALLAPLVECFAYGLQLIFVALLKGEPVPLGRFIPEPWPTVLPPGKKKKGKNKGTPPASKAAA